jgi:hypothetical protein
VAICFSIAILRAHLVRGGQISFRFSVSYWPSDIYKYIFFENIKSISQGIDSGFVNAKIVIFLFFSFRFSLFFFHLILVSYE